MKDYRAMLNAKPGGAKYVFGTNNDGNILRPLIDQDPNGFGAVLFPYTPTILVSGNAEYDDFSFTHSNYKTPAFSKSYPGEIQVTADFTAQTDNEAAYLLAVMHFLRSISKAYFGVRSSQDRAGTPPPVILFNYLGEFMFKDVPVIVKNYAYTLEPNVDYINVISRRTTLNNSVDLETMVPTKINISITLDVAYNTKKIRDTFDLDAFREGKYLGNNGTLGGFI